MLLQEVYQAKNKVKIEYENEKIDIQKNIKKYPDFNYQVLNIGAQ
jgi:hypothetical protein